MMRKLGLTLFITLLIIHTNAFLLQVKASDGFIRTNEIRFLLNGSPFYGNDFNAYLLMYMASYPSQVHKAPEAIREASNHGLAVARTCAFSDGSCKPLQYAPSRYNEDMLKYRCDSSVQHQCDNIIRF
ncbi:unnamed protein product, partial [Cuscuta epithymum]